MWPTLPVPNWFDAKQGGGKRRKEGKQKKRGEKEEKKTLVRPSQGPVVFLHLHFYFFLLPRRHKKEKEKESVPSTVVGVQDHHDFFRRFVRFFVARTHTTGQAHLHQHGTQFVAFYMSIVVDVKLGIQIIHDIVDRRILVVHVVWTPVLLLLGRFVQQATLHGFQKI
jgi:hypothetical protein